MRTHLWQEPSSNARQALRANYFKRSKSLDTQLFSM